MIMDRIQQRARTTEERYPRDDLNVRHTAPEAVALSGLSYGGTDDSQIHVLYRFPAESATSLSLQHERTPCGSRTPVLHTERQQSCTGDISCDARLASILHDSF